MNKEIKEYNKNGDEIHAKDSSDFEHWCEYDEKGNFIHFKNSRGYEYWMEHDEKGNCIHAKYSDEYEVWREYNENNIMINFRDNSHLFKNVEKRKIIKISKEEYEGMKNEEV